MENKDKKKNRSENLTTTIGDLLKSQGNDILKTEKKPYKKNNKKNKHYNKKYNNKPKESVNEKTIKDEVPVMKSNESLKKAIDKAIEKGILSNDDCTTFDMRTPEQIEKDTYKDGVIINDGSMEDLAKAFFAEPEKKEPVDNPNKFTIGAEYITKAGTDKMVKTNTFVK